MSGQPPVESAYPPAWPRLKCIVEVEEHGPARHAADLPGSYDERADILPRITPRVKPTPHREASIVEMEGRRGYDQDEKRDARKAADANPKPPHEWRNRAAGSYEKRPIEHASGERHECELEIVPPGFGDEYLPGGTPVVGHADPMVH
jgi:hypothetical protein